MELSKAGNTSVNPGTASGEDGAGCNEASIQLRGLHPPISGGDYLTNLYPAV